MDNSKKILICDDEYIDHYVNEHFLSIQSYPIEEFKIDKKSKDWHNDFTKKSYKHKLKKGRK